MKTINIAFKALNKNELSKIVGGQEEVNPCITSGSSGAIPVPIAGGSSTAMTSGGPGSLGGGSSVSVSNGNEAGTTLGISSGNTMTPKLGMAKVCLEGHGVL